MTKTIHGTDEIMFLDRSEGETARLVALARRAGLLSEADDPDLAGWETILLELHRLLRGPRIAAVLSCPECGAEASLIFGIADLPRGAVAEGAVVAGADLRALRLGDLLAADGAGNAEDRLTLLLARSAGRDPAWATQVLQGAERGAAVDALETLAAGLDIDLATTCVECGGGITTPFDVAHFVLAECEAGARHLLDDVHRIALAYHWSEAAILELPRARRQDYLARIEALTQI